MDSTRAKPRGRLDGLFGAGQPLGGHQRGGEAVLGRPPDEKGFQHVMVPNMMSRSPAAWVAAAAKAQHMCWTSTGSEDGVRRRGRGPEHPGGAGDVPADVVVVRVDGVADAAFHLDAEDQTRGVEEVLPGDRPVLGQRHQGGGHRPGTRDG